MTETELIYAAVRRWYPTRLFAVCDRVSWGLGLSYEADAIAISQTGLCDELEAKSTLSDLRADLKKHKWKLIETRNREHFADRFWYVVPADLEDAAVEQARPRGFGVVVVRPPEGFNFIGSAERVLKAERLHKDIPERRRRILAKVPELHRLAALRYWDAVGTSLQLEAEARTEAEEKAGTEQ